MSPGPARLGGLLSLTGGVDASDTPEEPAVEGRPSLSSPSFREVDFLRAGTPSGQVHWFGKNWLQRPLGQKHLTHVSLPVRTPHAVWFGLIALERVVSYRRRVRKRDVAYLDFFNATC